MSTAPGYRPIDQGGQGNGTRGGVVTHEMQLGGLVNAQQSAETGPKKTAARRQTLCRSCQLGRIIRKHAVIDACMGVVGRDLDIGDRDQTDARILDLETNQLGEISLDLIRNSLATIALFS
jgi:hypothetical protein